MYKAKAITRKGQIRGRERRPRRSALYRQKSCHYCEPVRKLAWQSAPESSEPFPTKNLTRERAHYNRCRLPRRFAPHNDTRGRRRAEVVAPYKVSVYVMLSRDAPRRPAPGARNAEDGVPYRQMKPVQRADVGIGPYRCGTRRAATQSRPYKMRRRISERTRNARPYRAGARTKEDAQCAPLQFQLPQCLRGVAVGQLPLRHLNGHEGFGVAADDGVPAVILRESA